MSKEYDEYLEKHIRNVQKAYNWICKNMPELNVLPVLYNVIDHDGSKYGCDEYDDYDEYFYGEGPITLEKQINFDYAWLHHIHNNPHHWQYWILIEDDNQFQVPRILEMPTEYVVEMVADWWSFSWASGNLSEIFDWYHEHKNIMKLHPKTRKLVEKILAKIKEEVEKIPNDK